MTNSPIKEDFLYYLWRTKRIGSQSWTTTDGREVEIVDFGTLNEDAGPDFFNAKVLIDGTVWAGNVEMHVFSSDWKQHQHHHNSAYDNVILHVVYEDDAPVQTKDGLRAIPALELKGKIPKIYLTNYLQLVQSNDAIPCQNMIAKVDQAKIGLWKYTLAIERLHAKSQNVAEILSGTGTDWEETLYIMISKYFGSKVNTIPFERLAKSLPLSILQKNKDKPVTIEALIFGQAGMLLADYKEPYFEQLKEEYSFQQKKYRLKHIDPISWKFSKLRPMNFPTVRLAQLASLLSTSISLFSKIKECEKTSEIKALFTCQTNSYWDTHYRFGTTSAMLAKNFGTDYIDLILINVVSPILYHYGKTTDDATYIDRAIAILESTKGENNAIIKLWKSLGIPTKTAFDTQALIHLKNNYCKEYQCLSCKIGHDIMSK
ncbi:MAG: DUF2851 family protein [Saprospiraceae bacterium]